MAETFGPFDGAPWAEADWYRTMTDTMPSGVYDVPQSAATNGALGWLASGLSITPAAGKATVGGAGYSRTPTLTSVTATANTHSSFSRRDRLVLRRSLATHNVTLAIIPGSAASPPVAPTITRDDTTYDLPLFSFLVPPASGTTITGIIDERVWLQGGSASVQSISQTTTGTLNATGSASVGSLSVSGSATVGGNVTAASGTATVSKVRITSTGDASPTSTGHGFQVGPDNGLNIIIDQNEVIARNNGVNAGSLGFAGTKLTGLLDPTASGDAATKGYVDAKFPDTGWVNLVPNSPFVAGSTGAKYRVLNKVCYFHIHLTRSSAWGANINAVDFPSGARPSVIWYVHTQVARPGADVQGNSTIDTAGNVTVGPAGDTDNSIYLTGSFPIG